MTAQLHLRATLAILAVTAIWLVALTLALGTRNPTITTAAAFDLTCTAGAAMYFLAVRRGHLPRWALTLTIATGAMAARLLLRDGGAIALAAGAMIELGAVAMVVLRIRTRGEWLPPGLRHLLATELQIMASAVAGWRTPRRDSNVFTSHRTNGWSLIAGTFIALTLIETPLVHVVLGRFGHTTIAWVATGLSLYSVAWLIGDLHALRHGGLIVTADALELRLGVRWRGQIPRAAITRVTACNGAPSKEVDFSILGANLLVTLDRPVELRGLFGRRRCVDALALSVDEPDRFTRAILP